MLKNELQMSGETELNKTKDRDRQPCEIWTRVMGYHRPVSSFNIGKKGEYYQRKFFSETKAELFKS